MISDSIQSAKNELIEEIVGDILVGKEIRKEKISYLKPSDIILYAKQRGLKWKKSDVKDEPVLDIIKSIIKNQKGKK